MGKAGCSIALIATVVIGSVALHYVLTTFAAFQWVLSNGTASTGWVDGTVTLIVVLAFALGFLAIIRMRDDNEPTSSDSEPPT